MTLDLENLTIGSIHSGYKSGEFTCEELTRAYLAQIAAHNEELNAYLTVDSEGAIERAKEIDVDISRKVKAGEEFLPLEGVPCGLKDIYASQGMRTTNGSKITKNMISPYDATATKRLKDAGVVILGKQNMDEFACGASTEHSAFGVTKNPYDLTRVAGGSSGGGASATAKGMAVFSMGTDTGGSIRQPASFCNLVGLKVTYGRVSRAGVTSMASSYDTIGHFSLTVEDSARVLQVTAGKDEYDSVTPDKEVPNYLEALGQDVKGLKIGVPKEYFEDGIDEETKIRVKEQIGKLKAMGAEVIEVSLPTTKYAMAVYYILSPTELSANLARFDTIRYGSKPEGQTKDLYDYYCSGREAGFGDEIKRRIMIGTYVSSSGYVDAYYKKAQKVRTVIINDFNKVFETVDVLIAPVTPTPAFKIGEKSNDPVAMYMADALVSPASCAGLSAMSVPSGFNLEGLPIGTQIIAPQFREDLLFRVGSKIEDRG
ncbi:MAG: Asp-tRNA(Asn)/Glu-tRNA(Gln) amidotransferase subunit GatA [Candidatus Peregrinibacteria bacterium]|nr:Asp-tRNA(Asn)/Glu-tRNA(Gln) amidotransferase subunit GatA [Candidatus Peregrinibacteria bacterium]MDZ4245071.1 Asp-tRNA(Asn)/Glu-tRNA(Gln) amidotransferase subunit GatA [Candidatus Gracilibacteria bacterium]